MVPKQQNCEISNDISFIFISANDQIQQELESLHKDIQNIVGKNINIDALLKSAVRNKNELDDLVEQNKSMKILINKMRVKCDNS